MINRNEAIRLVDVVSLAISEERELPVVMLTKIFDYVLQEKEVMLTVKEVMARYKVGSTKVYEWFESGLKKEKCAGTKIRVTDLEEFIKSGKA